MRFTSFLIVFIVLTLCLLIMEAETRRRDPKKVSSRRDGPRYSGQKRKKHKPRGAKIYSPKMEASSRDASLTSFGGKYGPSWRTERLVKEDKHGKLFEGEAHSPPRTWFDDKADTDSFEIEAKGPPDTGGYGPPWAKRGPGRKAGFEGHGSSNRRRGHHHRHNKKDFIQGHGSSGDWGGQRYAVEGSSSSGPRHKDEDSSEELPEIWGSSGPWKRRHHGRRPPADWSQPWRRFFDGGPRRFELGIGHSLDDSWFNFDLNFGRWFDKERNWWSGPNVCMSRTESVKNDTDDGEIQKHTSVHSKICDETDTMYKCTTTVDIFGKRKVFTEIKECCHGYARIEGELGCTKELDLKDIVETAEKMNLTEFVRAMDSVGLRPELQQGNFTVFAPVNQAFKMDPNILPEMPQPKDDAKPFPVLPESNLVLVSRPITDMLVNNMKQMMLGHVVVDTVKTSDMKDEQKLATGSPEESTIRINFYDYPHKMITANCARVLKANVQATNGIIHTVERVLSPVTTSLIGIISKNPDLSTMMSLLKKTDLVKTLKNEDGHFTIFAPTNSAFEKLPLQLQKKLFKGDACLKKILLQHMLPRVICSAVIDKRVRTSNMLGRYMGLTRDDNKKIFADGVQVVGTDLMATNGVLHLVDEVIIPDDALSILEVAEKNGAKKIVELIKKANLVDKLNNMENLTIFAPSDEAFENVDDDISDALEMDPEFLTEVLTYHVTSGDHKIGELRNGNKLKSLLQNKKLAISEYFNFPFGRERVKTVQCSPVTKHDLKACNGVIHVIDKVMRPPEVSILDVIRVHEELQTFYKLLLKVGLADKLEEEGPITVLAPTDLALEDIGHIEEDEERLKTILQNHIIKDTVCCSGIFPGKWFLKQQVWTSSGEIFPMGRTEDDQPLVDKAQIIACDTMATNGVIQIVDRIIVKRHQVEERRIHHGRHPLERWREHLRGWGHFFRQFQ